MTNAFSVVRQFEDRVAEFTGAPHVVAVDCCTSALFLCLKYVSREVPLGQVGVPARTYASVPMAVIHAGGFPVFDDREWRGLYFLDPFEIVDAAKAFHRDMFFRAIRRSDGAHTAPLYMCLSFHAKKLLNIGRGGAVLTDDDDAAEWLRRARYDGREGRPYPQERITQLGWHCYLTPEQAARGLQLLDAIPDNLPDQVEDYPDLREQPVFKGLAA